MAGPTSIGDGAARGSFPGDPTPRSTNDLGSQRFDDASDIESLDVGEVSVSPSSPPTRTSSASTAAALPGTSGFSPESPLRPVPPAPGSTGTDKSKPQSDEGSLMDQARSAAFRGLDAQKARAATGLSSLVDALREGGRHLAEENPKLASYVDRAASQAERVVSGLRDRDLRGAATDLERFARQRPAMFLGGAFALGLLAARFLKSSAETSNGHPPRGGM